MDLGNFWGLNELRVWVFVFGVIFGILRCLMLGFAFLLGLCYVCYFVFALVFWGWYKTGIRCFWFICTLGLGFGFIRFWYVIWLTSVWIDIWVCVLSIYFDLGGAWWLSVFLLICLVCGFACWVFVVWLLCLMFACVDGVLFDCFIECCLLTWVGV